MTRPEEPTDNALMQEFQTAIVKKFADLHEKGLLLKSWAAGGVAIAVVLLLEKYVLSFPPSLVLSSILLWIGSFLHVKSAISVARYRDNGFEEFDNEAETPEAAEVIEEEEHTVQQVKRDYARGELTDEEFESELEELMGDEEEESNSNQSVEELSFDSGEVFETELTERARRGD